MFITLPYSTTHPIRRFPRVTVALIAVNALVFFFASLAGEQESIIENMGYTPADPSLLHAFTSTFIHGGFMHLLGNMWYLWVFGSVVEDGLGHWVYLGFYMLTAMAATGLHHWVAAAFMPASMSIPCVGASGAVSGVLGICAVRFYRTRVRIWYLFYLFFIFRQGVFSIPSWIALSLWFAPELLSGIIMAAMGISGGVAHWAHVGGFALGVWLALFFDFERKGRQDAFFEEGTGAVPAHSAVDMEVELRREISRDRTDTQAYMRLGSLLLDRKRNEEAASTYLRAMKVFFASGRNAAGLDAYDRALKASVAKPLPDGDVYLAAAALQEEKKSHEALELFGRLSENSTDPDLREQAVLRRAGIMIRDFRRAAEAAGLLRDFLAGNPHSIWRNQAAEMLREAEKLS